MMVLLQKFKMLVLALIFVVAVAAAYYSIDQMIVSKGDALATQSETIVNQRAFETQYQQLQSVVADTEAERVLLDSFILQDDADTIAFLTDIDEIAVRNNLMLETKRLSVEEMADSDFNVLKLEYEIEGFEKQVMNMIKVFETLPHHGYISKVTIDRKGAGRTPGVEISAKISLELTIKDYD